jgi:hypothetical protein
MRSLQGAVLGTVPLSRQEGVAERDSEVTSAIALINWLDQLDLLTHNQTFPFQTSGCPNLSTSATMAYSSYQML